MEGRFIIEKLWNTHCNVNPNGGHSPIDLASENLHSRRMAESHGGKSVADQLQKSEAEVLALRKQLEGEEAAMREKEEKERQRAGLERLAQVEDQKRALEEKIANAKGGESEFDPPFNTCKVNFSGEAFQNGANSPLPSRHFWDLHG